MTTKNKQPEYSRFIGRLKQISD